MAYQNSEGKWVYSDAELKAQFVVATERGEASLRDEPHGKAVYFEASENRFVIELTNGVIFMVPRPLVEGVAAATSEAAADVTLDALGEALHWKQLDQDISVAGMVAGSFGTRRWMAQLSSQFGKRGGSARSSAKTAAVRANGQKGGRPRKQTV